MATAHAIPTYTGSGHKIRTRPQQFEAEHTHIVAGFDWFRLLLSCPRHAWTWPRTNREERVKGFDAHQTCLKCASRRLFNSKDWQPGPIYRSRSRHND